MSPKKRYNSYILTIIKETVMKKFLLAAILMCVSSPVFPNENLNCLDVKSGWQMFGLSEGIANVENKFGNDQNIVESVWSYDGKNKKWKFYSPDDNLSSIAATSPNIGSITNIAPKEGFWLKGKTNKQICFQKDNLLPNFASVTVGPVMNTARMVHNIITLPNGNILLIGGHGSGFIALKSAEILDLKTNSFSQIQMNYTHDIGAVAKIEDGEYLIAGGAGDLGTAPGNNNIEIFDSNTSAFTSVGTMQKSRTGNTAVTLGNKVLIVGGWYDSGNTATPEIVDLLEKKSTLTGALNVPRSYPWALPTNDSKAVVFWGMPSYGGDQYDSVELYSPNDNNFTLLTGTMLNESGWKPFTNYLPRLASDQKMKNGKYLLWAHKDVHTSLISFDPEEKKFTKIDTTPSLPDTNKEVVFDLLVNKHKNIAIALSSKVGSEPNKLSVYVIKLDDMTLYKILDGYTMPTDFHLGLNSDILLPNGKILITGGFSQTGGSTNFSPVKKTFIVELMHKDTP